MTYELESTFHVDDDHGHPWTVYHKDASGAPEAHQGGPWFYEPQGWQGDVFSAGYSSWEAAADEANADRHYCDLPGRCGDDALEASR